MPVRFFVDDSSSLGLTVTHEQAAALLLVLGLEDVDAQQGPGPHTGAFRGNLKGDWLSLRIASLRRQLTRGRVSEFTSTELTKDGLIRCLLALQNLAEKANATDGSVAFTEVTQ
jgi:hypothetical protein